MFKITIHNEGNTPLYHQVKASLLGRITSGEWKEGDLIPTEIELMEEFNVSRTTIRQAISLLVHDEILEKRQGLGTKVKSLKLTGSLGRLTGFAEEIVERGYIPKSRLLKYDIREDLFIEKKQLNMLENDKVVSIQRLRFIDEEPIAIERTNWPEEIGNLLLSYDLNDAKYYEVLEKHHKYLKRAHETIAAINATSYEAELLGVSPGAALLEMTRLSYGVDDKPIEYTVTKFRSDLYQYKIDLHR